MAVDRPSRLGCRALRRHAQGRIASPPGAPAAAPAAPSSGRGLRARRARGSRRAVGSHPSGRGGRAGKAGRRRRGFRPRAAPISFLTFASGSVAMRVPPDLTEVRPKSLTAVTVTSLCRLTEFGSLRHGAPRIERRQAAFLFQAFGTRPMAKPATVKIKLVSTADTGFFYVTKKNPRTQTEKMSFKKYDPRRAQARRVQGSQDQVSCRLRSRQASALRALMTSRLGPGWPAPCRSARLLPLASRSLDGLREPHHRDRLRHIGLRARCADPLFVALRRISGDRHDRHRG